MKVRLKKDGTPRKEAKLKTIVKPRFGCQHVWRLNGMSNIPKCEKCEGEALLGTMHHATAFVQARMASDRGTRPCAYRDSGALDD